MIKRHQPFHVKCDVDEDIGTQWVLVHTDDGVIMKRYNERRGYMNTEMDKRDKE